ncbi:sensor histidine kinase [Actinomadura rupiterrae]|uniref:sensor histidine kinase n=1 Tax=Actinomadura rupiterrae TaxID=559627 RepID=UPI0020A29EAB|nr:histidine kinase [Actinomadura rupiterrae]MCP2338345.1 two-component system sensor histidine kinase DesK [Actinomadura rupiterrae]
MDATTSAELERRAATRFERYRRVTYRSFLIAGAGIISPTVIGLFLGHRDGRLPVPLIALALAGLALLFGYYARIVRAGLDGSADRRDVVAGGAVALLLAPLLIAHPLAIMIPYFWLSAVVLSPMRVRTIVWICLGTAAVEVTFAGVGWALVADRPVHWWALPVAFAAFAGTAGIVAFVNRYQRRIWDLHVETHAVRQALARVAVSEERLRFSRDLHDLLGHSLSLIAVKSELAMRMAETDPARARAEMADVRRAARDALREVRAAVRGYRAIELDAELAGVRAVLETAGVRCEAGPIPDDLPPDVRTVLAWVIREGATNVIKHSDARTCTIDLTRYGDTVVLELTNDGVTTPSNPRKTPATVPNPKAPGPNGPFAEKPGVEGAVGLPEPGMNESRPTVPSSGVAGSKIAGSKIVDVRDAEPGDGGGPARSAGDDPGGRGFGGGEGGGSGLAGLRERVAVLGGELSADLDGRDRFVLRAVLPLDGSVRAPRGAA